MSSEVGTGKKVARFVVAAMVGIALIVTGTLLAPVLTNYIPLFGTHSESRNTEVIQSITREEQVVLLSLGIEGIEQKDQTGTSWFNDLPFTGRSKIIQYGFKAKLGIEGKDVAIKETGTGTYLVSIPKFIFIGHDNVSFKSAFEKNGALSFVTEEIDELDMANTILNSDAQKEYISQNESILKDQAESFYEEIITSIDPAVVVDFEFKS